MKKKIIITMVLLAICLTSNFNVYAEESKSFYVNDNGVAISKKNYDNFLKIGFNETEIENMTQDVYNSYKDMDDVNLEQSVIKYFRETTVSRYRLTNTVVEEISKADYEKETPSKLPGLPTVSHETTYKRLEISIGSIGDIYSSKHVNVILDWKKVPKIKSYDIIAARVTNGEINNNTITGSFTSKETKFDANCAIAGSQYFTNNYAPTYNGWNIQNGVIGKTGVGLTAKLSTGSAVCTNDLGLFVSVPQGYSSALHFQAPIGTTVYGTYQHAQETVDFNSVRNAYRFNNNGLGNVIYFSNSSLTNSYDGMAGVSITIS